MDPSWLLIYKTYPKMIPQLHKEILINSYGMSTSKKRQDNDSIWLWKIESPTNPKDVFLI